MMINDTKSRTNSRNQVTKAINRNLAEFIVIAADTVPVQPKLTMIIMIKDTIIIHVISIDDDNQSIIIIGIIIILCEMKNDNDNNDK